MKKNIAIVTTHPIQYQIPLFKKFNKSKFINLFVFFGSRHGKVSIKKDLEFNEKFNWDIDASKGYNHFFPKKEGDIDSFFLGFSKLKEKFLANKINKVVIFGWNKLIYFQAIIAAISLNIPIYLRAENNLEKKNFFFKKFIKKFFFNFFFKLFDKIFYIGKLNKDFYKYYGVEKKKLIFTPYFVDINFFKSNIDFNQLKKIKSKFNIKKNNKVFLFVGKLIERKNPFLIIDYFKTMPKEAVCFIVGNGPLKEKLKNIIREKKIKNIFFLGFLNQRKLSTFYKFCDYLFLPSKYETWGLVVNEAFALGKPCIVTNKCGCRKDLIKDFQTGVTINHFYDKSSLKKISKLIKIKKKKIENNISKKNKIYTIENSFKKMEKILK